jgi:hypothetical protein
MGLVAMDRVSTVRTPEQPVKRRFDRQFVCPTKGERFTATLVVTETPMSKVTDVTVGDSVDPPDDR